MSTTIDPAQALLTPEDVLALPDAVAYELDDGRLVERDMSIDSSSVGANLHILVGYYAKSQSLGKTFASDLGLRIFRDRPNKFRRPDVCFYRFSRLRADMKPLGFMEIPPDLVAEVVSPGDSYYEVDRKVVEYLQAGVQLVWVLNPSIRTVHIYRSDGSFQLLQDHDFLDGEEPLPGFRCQVSELFEFPTNDNPAGL